MRTTLDKMGAPLKTGARRAGEPLTTADVCFEVVKPATAARKCSFAELDAAPGESGPATAFVSHAWLYPFEWLVSALEAANLPADTFFWFDVAVVNQHVNADRGFDWWSSTFRQAVKTIGRTLLVLAPWRAPVPLTRAWCIWEIFCTVDTDTELRVLLPAAERDAFATALVDDFDSIVEVVCAVDVEKAEAHSDTDRDNIFAAVRETCGFHKLNVAAAGGLRGALALAGAQVLGERNAAGDEALGLAFKLAHLYLEQGKYDEAKAMYERVLASKERTLGADHPDTLATVNNLALVLSDQGKLDEASRRCTSGRSRARSGRSARTTPARWRPSATWRSSSRSRASSTRRRR